MNGQLTRVAWTAMALLVALVVATTYWQTWARPGLAARQDNEIQRVAEFQIKRGLILAPDARARPQPRRAPRRQDALLPQYPQGKLAAHVVGYSTVARARAGLERSLNGDPDRDGARPRRPRRAPARQAPAQADRRRHRRHDARREGAAGRARARSDAGAAPSPPSTRGREAPRDGLVAELQPEPRREPLRPDRADHGRLPPAAPLLNRASPGSLSAGLDVQGRDGLGGARARTAGSPGRPSSIRGTASPTASGSTTSTRAGRSGRSTSRRRSSTPSTRCSATSARRSARSGSSTRPGSSASTSGRRSRRPRASDMPSGLYRRGELWYPERNSDVDAGRMAFGQERMLVTPLQMAMVAGRDRQRGDRHAPVRRREARLAEGPDGRPHEAGADRPRRGPGRRA